jgi:copper chaperone CopZ
MKKILLLLVFTSMTWGENPHDHMHDSHEGHLHEELVDGKKLEVDPDRFDKFIMDLKDSQIAVVNVKGMVCDFCARGIEKTFMKDAAVKKIDVDLTKGKVLIAYTSDAVISFDAISQKILANGQNATGMSILKI